MKSVTPGLNPPLYHCVCSRILTDAEAFILCRNSAAVNKGIEGRISKHEHRESSFDSSLTVEASAQKHRNCSLARALLKIPVGEPGSPLSHLPKRQISKLPKMVA